MGISLTQRSFVGLRRCRIFLSPGTLGALVFPMDTSARRGSRNAGRRFGTRIVPGNGSKASAQRPGLNDVNDACVIAVLHNSPLRREFPQILRKREEVQKRTLLLLGWIFKL